MAQTTIYSIIPCKCLLDCSVVLIVFGSKSNGLTRVIVILSQALDLRTKVDQVFRTWKSVKCAITKSHVVVVPFVSANFLFLVETDVEKDATINMRANFGFCSVVKEPPALLTCSCTAMRTRYFARWSRRGNCPTMPRLGWSAEYLDNSIDAWSWVGPV